MGEINKNFKSGSRILKQITLLLFVYSKMIVCVCGGGVGGGLVAWEVPGLIPHYNIDLHWRILFVLYPRKGYRSYKPFTFPQKLRHLFINREVENCSAVVQASLVILVLQAPWSQSSYKFESIFLANLVLGINLILLLRVSTAIPLGCQILCVDPT